MSTELVKAEFMSEAVANYGCVSLQGIPDDYAMTPEEEQEAAGISAGFKHLQFDGSEGRFKDLDTDETYDELKGAVLAPLTDGQALFPTDAERAADIYPQTYLCRSFAVDQPPMLNPALTPEQKAKLEQDGAGRDCQSCPLRQFGPNGEKPRCNTRTKFLAFLAEFGEPAIVEAGGTSIKPVRHYFKQLKKQRIGKRPAAFYAFASRFFAEKVVDPEDKQRKWYEFRAERGGLMPPNAFGDLRSIKTDTLSELEAFERAMLERREARGALPPAPAQQAQQAPPADQQSHHQPAPTVYDEGPVQSSFILNEDGTVAFEGEVVAGGDAPEYDAKKAPWNK